MIPVDQVAFAAGTTLAPTLFVSNENGAKALVCTVGAGEPGLLWLDGSERLSPSHLNGRNGIFIRNCSIDVELDSLVPFGTLPVAGSILVREGSLAIRAEGARGATLIYTISGPAFGEPAAHAAFERWRLMVTAPDGKRTAAYAFIGTMGD